MGEVPTTSPSWYSPPRRTCSSSPTLGSTGREGRRRAEAAVRDESALERYERWVRAQGGDPSEDVLPRRRSSGPSCPESGYVRSLRALPSGDRGARARRRRAQGRRDRPRRRCGLPAQAWRRVERGEPIAEIPRAPTTKRPRPPSWCSARTSSVRSFRSTADRSRPRPLELPEVETVRTSLRQSSPDGPRARRDPDGGADAPTDPWSCRRARRRARGR